MKRNLIAAAIIAAAGMGAQTAYAINEAPDGRGEFAYVPYYTVNNSMNTEFTITNTSANTLAVKVMFREGRYSRDVRDFHVYLSPFDMWSATVTQGDNGGARVVSGDNSCTAPWLNDLGDGTRDVQFTESLVTGINQNSSLTAEGYIAITVMGASPAGIENVTDSVANLVKHDANGWPKNCGAVVSTWGKAIQGGQGEPSDAIQRQFGEPVNALAVTAKIVDPNSGNSTTVPSTIMANYFNPLGVDGAALNDLGTSIIQAPELLDPNESNTTPAIANFMDGTGPRSISYTSGTNAFAGALMRTSVANVYNTQGSNTTEYVITFPMKRNYVVYDLSNNPIAVLPPYNPAPAVELGSPVVVTSYTDAEEFAVDCIGPLCNPSLDFSPPQAGPTPNVEILPNEVNVVRINGSDALRSALTVDASLDIDDAGNVLNLGWTGTTFIDSVGLVGTDLDTGLAVTQGGFPVVGFSFERMNGNGVMDAIESNYSRVTQ